MIEIAYYLLLILIISSAAGAVFVRGMITSVIVLSVLSVSMTAAFAFLQAVDVAMAEAVIGAGLLTAFFVAAISRTRRSR